jgi:hypothetical protein
VLYSHSVHPHCFRHPDLDITLTKERFKAEARALLKCKTLGVSFNLLSLPHLSSSEENCYFFYHRDLDCSLDTINGFGMHVLHCFGKRKGTFSCQNFSIFLYLRCFL